MFKNRVTAKYNVVDSVWYHGRAATNPSFDLELVGKGNDEQGPAFYFTSDIKDATGYAYPSGIVITAQVQPKKLVDGKAKAAEVEKLIRKSPVFHDALSNYDENPGTAFRIAFKGIMDQGSALDSFLSVWYEFYRYHPRAYLENIVELGYDGHLVPRQGGVQHLMIYNPKVIKVLEETPYSEVQAEVKASASPFIKKLRWGTLEEARAAKVPSTGVYQNKYGRFRVTQFGAKNWQVDYWDGVQVITYPASLGDVFNSKAEAIQWIKDLAPTKILSERQMPEDGTWTGSGQHFEKLEL